jgi:4-amino-4-deoxy-L-arabinose transferase-like glycosyltransferase
VARTNRSRSLALWTGLLLLAALFYGRGLGNFLIDDDEEGYAYAAWRVSEGDLPYRDFLSPQLPGFLYTGAATVLAAGRDTEALRAVSVILVLGAGAAVFVTGTSLLGRGGGLLAAALFLAAEDVFAVGRAFRPEALMLAATTWATALLVVGEAGARGRGRSAARAGASLLFGLGLLAKLFAALPWAASLAYFAGEWLNRRLRLPDAVRAALSVAIPGGALVAAVMAAFVVAAPQTVDAVLGHHLRQGEGMGALAVAVKTALFFRSALERNALLLAFVPAGIAGLRAVGGPRAWIVVWQLPTALAFFLLTRDLYHRHLVVLFPAACLCVAGVVVWFARSAQPGRLARLATASVSAALVIALAVDSWDTVRSPERGTAALGALTRALAAPGTLVLSDTPGPAFHAGRRTTYSAAGLSAGAAHSGQITSHGLLAEIAESPGASLDLVLVDASPAAGHLRELPDYEILRGTLDRAYEHLGTLERAHLSYDVFLRPGSGRTDRLADYELLAARVGADGPGAPRRARWAVRSAPEPSDVVCQWFGDRVRSAPSRRGMDIALRVPAGASPPTGSELAWRVLGLEDAECASGRAPLVDAAGRGPEEWSAGELVGLSYELVIPGDVPRHALQIGIAAEGGAVDWADVDVPVEVTW